MDSHDRIYGFALGLGSLLMAVALAETEKDAERRAKKYNVANRKRSLLRESFPDEPSWNEALLDGAGISVTGVARALRPVCGDWEDDQGRALLIDLSMSDPFAPYEGVA